MKRLLPLLMVALLTGAMACTKVSYVNPATTPTGQSHSEKGHFFVFGLVGNKTIDAAAMCPTGVHRVQSKFSFLDLVLGTLTVGLYAPRTYTLECGMGGGGAS
jgi:hypothetical protein